MTRVARWSRTLQDRRRPLDERAAAARALAALATDDAVDTLAAALEGDAWTVRAKIAESLGLADHPRARQFLGALVEDPRTEVACAAVHGLVWKPGGEAAVDLIAILGDASRGLAVRCGAARALARVGGRTTGEALARTIAATPHEPLRAACLAALASRSRHEVCDLFAWLLVQTRGARRIAALEALGDAADDVAHIAVPYLTDDSREIREAAALAIADALHPGGLGNDLIDALSDERELAVRFALYHALANQVAFDLEHIVSCVVAERSPELQLVGAAAAAAEVARRPAAGEPFERTIVPMLTAIALDTEATDDALAAVAILAGAGTSQCQSALRVIAASARTPVAAAARAASGGGDPS